MNFTNLIVIFSLFTSAAEASKIQSLNLSCGGAFDASDKSTDSKLKAELEKSGRVFGGVRIIPKDKLSGSESLISLVHMAANDFNPQALTHSVEKDGELFLAAVLDDGSRVKLTYEKKYGDDGEFYAIKKIERETKFGLPQKLQADPLNSEGDLKRVSLSDAMPGRHQTYVWSLPANTSEVTAADEPPKYYSKEEFAHALPDLDASLASEFESGLEVLRIPTIISGATLEKFERWAKRFEKINNNLMATLREADSIWDLFKVQLLYNSGLAATYSFKQINKTVFKYVFLTALIAATSYEVVIPGGRYDMRTWGWFNGGDAKTAHSKLKKNKNVETIDKAAYAPLAKVIKGSLTQLSPQWHSQAPELNALLDDYSKDSSTVFMSAKEYESELMYLSSQEAAAGTDISFRFLPNYPTVMISYFPTSKVFILFDLAQQNSPFLGVAIQKKKIPELYNSIETAFNTFSASVPMGTGINSEK
jgi:hypothetical protein